MKAIVLASVVLLVGSPASADVDVTPDPSRPGLILDGTRLNSPHKSHGDRSNPFDSHPVIDSEPTIVPLGSCQVDPTVGTYGCRTDSPVEGPDAEEPELTPGDVLRAVREIGLPSLEAKVQPGAATLVNVETIFSADPLPFERSVDLLGFVVDVVAEPVSYRWIYGDGSTRVTGGPGRPYPAMDVVHRYEQPADDVRARVDVTYRVRFRVDGGAWQGIGQTLTATGPDTVLQVDEAAPVLTRG